MGDTTLWVQETWADVRGNWKYEALRSGALLMLIPMYHFVVSWIGPTAPSERVIGASVAFAFVFFVLSSLIETLKKRVLNLSVSATGGPSEQLFLNVRNEGETVTLSSFCEILGSYNDPNAIRKGEFQCGWSDGSAPKVTLEKGESSGILIATFQQHSYKGEDPDIMHEAQIMSLGAKRWDSFHWWWTDKMDKLPCFTIKVRVVGKNAKSPREYLFTLRPVKPYGPLELVTLPSNSLYRV